MIEEKKPVGIIHEGKEYPDCIHIITHVRVPFLLRLRYIFYPLLRIDYEVYTDVAIKMHKVEGRISHMSYLDIILGKIRARRHRGFEEQRSYKGNPTVRRWNKYLVKMDTGKKS